MNKYTINIDYTTGDSERSHRSVEEVGMSWTNLDKAKLALKYIKAHYTAYLAEENPVWENGSYRNFDVATIANEPWYYGPLFEPDAQFRGWRNNVVIEKDDGTRFAISTFWTGCFERLHSGEIICEQDTDMKISF